MCNNEWPNSEFRNKCLQYNTTQNDRGTLYLNYSLFINQKYVSIS